MAKAKKEVIVEKKPQIQEPEETKATQPLNVSEMTIIEIMHQKNISREDAISFIKNNQPK